MNSKYAVVGISPAGYTNKYFFESLAEAVKLLNRYETARGWSAKLYTRSGRKWVQLNG